MTAPAFIIATDLLPQQPEWACAAGQAEALGPPCARIFGFTPRIRMACLTEKAEEPVKTQSLAAVVDEEAAAGVSQICVLPVSFDSSVRRAEALGSVLARARRKHPHLTCRHDGLDPAHPLLVAGFTDNVARAVEKSRTPAARSALLLAASGQGDSGARAQAYRFMRLLWEQTGVGHADVAFVRHAQPKLATALERCRKSFRWLVLPYSLWPGEHFEVARLVLSDHRRTDPDAADWQLLEPPGAHPSILAWLTQRMMTLWQDRS